MKVAVVVALFDEEETVGELTRRLVETLSCQPSWDWRIVFVVEGTDRTKPIVEAVQRDEPRIDMLYAATATGLGNAFRRGFAAVPPETEWIVTLDGDLNHQPEEIPRLVEEARAGNLDILVGSRRAAGSETIGTPRWKRLLSGAFNWLVRPLLGISVRDATSGFRVYRARILGELATENSGFAFLPELLTRAADRGFVIGESPIRFVFRTAGTSKMGLVATSRSYLGLLWHNFGPMALPLVVLLLGAILRLALAFPVYRFPAEADALLGPIAALRVLAGEWPVFMTPTRLGAVGGYVMAAFFGFFGAERFAIHLAPAVVSIATMVVWFLACRELLGRQEARWAVALVAFAPPALLFWTSMPNAYPEVVGLCVLVLYLAARMVRRGPTLVVAVALGGAIGLGLWQSLQTLACSVPAVLWLALNHPKLAAAGLRLRHLWGFAAAAVVGAGPLLAYHLNNNDYLAANFATRPVRSLDALLANTHYFLFSNVAEALASVDVLGFRLPTSPLLVALKLAVALALILGCGLGVARGLRHAGRGGPMVLVVLVVLLTAAINIASEAGSVRGLTVRYALPVVLVVPFAMAHALAALRSRAGLATLGLGAAMLALNLLVLPLPGGAQRTQWRRDLDIQALRTAEIAAKGPQVVLGYDYWGAYHLNFFLHGKVVALPWHPQDDALRLESELDPRARLALMVLGANDEVAERKLRLAGFPVTPDGTDDGLVGPIVLPRPTREALAALRNPPSHFAADFETGRLDEWSAVCAPGLPGSDCATE